MEARGISGGELARRTGFTAQYINSLRSKERGARLPLDTARRLSHALGVSVEWLTAGTGQRERLSDVYPIFVARRSESGTFVEPYASRAEAIALLATTVEPEVIAALRTTVPPDRDADPGRDFWIERARQLAGDLRRIKQDPVLRGEGTRGEAARPPDEDGATSKHAPPTARKRAK
jgi:transcriptional regulator with XRE-family HTH domain